MAGELWEINGPKRSWHRAESMKTCQTGPCVCVCVFETGLPISIKHIMLIKPQRTVVIQAGVCVCVCVYVYSEPLLLLASDLHGEQQHCS